ncbi:hypothetical protein HanXRQr2_Chr01g0042151 [Helianthus annuus]|uniref:Uncharacterized protein n=1 Tax=Helianthus annuus TaxID=4232 RepID=A0A9K3P610_HELAN|nr:hypothetical protein HanXRQr2_Chr01g0042151 [Helianthus annuus]
MFHLIFPTFPFRPLQPKRHLVQLKISFPLTCFEGTLATHLDVEVYTHVYLWM